MPATDANRENVTGNVVNCSVNNSERYVRTHLPSALRAVEDSFRGAAMPNLTNFEKALIYDYSDEGYRNENENLRNGRELTEFGKLLTKALKKIDDYRLLCFRVTTLTAAELDFYRNNSIITEPAFISASTSIAAASVFPHNVRFDIHSKRGKKIEEIAKFGINSGQNEREVLFLSNSKFEVLEVYREFGIDIVTLEEI